MEILGIGINELIFIVIIALILLGPKDMQKAGSTIGRWLRSIITSDGWKVFQQTSRELRTLPHKLMRDANEELNQIGSDLKDASNPAAQRVNNPNMPPRSEPLPEPSKPMDPTGNTVSTPATEQKDNESSQQKDA
jgi:Sec-independent protein translocase protein TatA